MREHAERKCSPKTIERYGELGVYAAKHIGDARLNEIGTMQVELMVNALRDHGGAITAKFPNGRPLAPKTVRHIACVVHGCFEKAVNW